MASSCKEQYLLTREVMYIARKTKGILFGGCISTYFMRRHYANQYKRTLIKNNELEHFDENYQKINYNPETYTGRNTNIRDVDAYFEFECDARTYIEELYKIPGVYDVVPISNKDSVYKRHVLFDKHFTLQKYVVKYLFDHSFCSFGRTLTVYIDIVISKPDSEYRHPPTVFMQELTVKQLLWDSNGIRCNKMSNHPLEHSFDILDDFVSKMCFIKPETSFSRQEMRDLLPKDGDFYYNQESEKITAILERMIESRIAVIIRLLSYHKQYTVVNSPMCYEKDGSCGICFTKTHHVLKWKTSQNNSQFYCFRCVLEYLNSFKKVEVCDYHNHEEYDDDNEYFHNDPILTNREWKYLTVKQIYLIENIFVCPVGNKANFSVYKTHNSHLA